MSKITQHHYDVITAANILITDTFPFRMMQKIGAGVQQYERYGALTDTFLQQLHRYAHKSLVLALPFLPFQVRKKFLGREAAFCLSFNMRYTAFSGRELQKWLVFDIFLLI